MATITYNNIESASNLITFTDIPNILTVDDGQGGYYSSFRISVSADWQGATSSNGQWYITFMGETITNVLDPKNAVNKNFYIASTVASTIASMVRAFRNCPSLSATFTIEMDNNTVWFKSRANGNVFTQPNYYQSNATSYVSASASEGDASQLNGQLVDVDIYADGEYITTLEKTCYGGMVQYNVSPVLATVTEAGRTTMYNMQVSAIDADGNYNVLGTVPMNYSSVGYMCNQGAKYLDNSYPNIAQNYYRGKEKGDVNNNTILYIYSPHIPISLYKSDMGGATITIDYLDSAYNVLTSQTYQWTAAYQEGSILYDFTIDIATGEFAPIYHSDTFYVDVTIPSAGKVRYNVIKPLRATEYAQRLLWRNSYGGTSFYDFTGERSESHELETMTYQKNIFNYYTDPMNELTKVYNNEVEYKVTIKSHLMEKDGIWVFNDLMQSPLVWTEVGGEKYAIIIDSVSVDETDQNDIYQATVTYHYSAEPSLI